VGRRGLAQPRGLFLAIVLGGIAQCAAGEVLPVLGWPALKSYLQPGVQILQEDEHRLVLGLAGDAHTRLVLTLQQSPESDVFASVERRRGRESYPVWEISERLWHDPNRPRRIWSRFLRSEFWYVARPPRSELAR
jgi:hypothetical protein